MPDFSHGVDPVGIKEIKDRLGVERKTVEAWRFARKRHPFPEPRWEVGGRAAWDWTDVTAWLVATGRMAADGTTATPNAAPPGRKVPLGADPDGAYAMLCGMYLLAGQVPPPRTD